MKRYAILIPCYNEAHRIRDTVLKTHKALKGLKHYTIYVINDASTDNIKEVLTLDLKCELINYVYGPSRRENLSKAIMYIDADVIAFMDADLSTDLKDLKKLLTSVNDKNPIVIGNKYGKKSVIKRSKFRLVVSKLMNLFTRILFNTGLDDHFIGFKAFKGSVIKSLCEEVLFNIKDRSMFWDAEILITALRRNYKVKTIPVTWTEGKTTSLKILKDYKIVLYMFKFWWKMLWQKK